MLTLDSVLQKLNAPYGEKPVMATPPENVSKDNQIHSKINDFNEIISIYKDKRVKKKIKRKEMIEAIGNYIQNNLVIEDEL